MVSLGAPPQRLTVDVGTAQQLVAEQFPEWAGLPVRPVDSPGWDNYTFRLGDELTIRLPSAAEYGLAVEKEQRWLPRLAPHLPVPIPSVRGAGVPGAGYPYAWSVYDWLDGSPATAAGIADQRGLGAQLADFLVALRGVDATEGPRPGVHNWYRGGTLRTYDDIARGALDRLAGHVDVDRAAAVWHEALEADWSGEDTWFHGDLAAGNLLLSDGRLTGVIDFGTCGVGDPSCDLAIAWTLLDEAGRHVFRDRLGVDDSAWTRGRGWALWKTLSGLASAVEDADDEDAAPLLRVVEALLARDA